MTILTKRYNSNMGVSVLIIKINPQWKLTSILGWDALGHPNQKEVYPVQCILSK